MGRYLDLAKSVIPSSLRGSGEGSLAQNDCEGQELASAPTQSCDDFYSRAVRVTLDQVCPISYPDGMIKWLEGARPEAYTRLTQTLPREIDRMWNVQAPRDEFQRVLDDFLREHQNAVAAFVEAQLKYLDPE